MRKRITKGLAFTLKEVARMGAAGDLSELWASLDMDQKAELADGEEWRTAGMAAAAAGDEAIVDRLIERGWKGEGVESGLSWLPMHLAAMRGEARAIEKMIKAGVSSGEKNFWGATPLHYAATGLWKGKDGMAARALLMAGADAGAKDAEGEEPVHWASRHGETEILRVLAEFGCDLSARNHRGETAGHKAVMEGQEDALRLLLKLGWNPCLENQEGKTAGMVAKETGRAECWRILEEAERAARERSMLEGSVKGEAAGKKRAPGL